MKGIYPGTFDPITNGHMDVISRAHKIFDELVIAVGNNPQKNCTFDCDARIAMIKESVVHLDRIEVIGFTGLTVDAARLAGANVIVRGLRAISDYELEVQMAIMNRTLDSSIDTVILVATHHWSFISSSLIKDIALFGGDISRFVPPPVMKRFEEAKANRSALNI
jgi:pantetheine-phosphate adenylyltransferase